MVLEKLPRPRRRKKQSLRLPAACEKLEGPAARARPDCQPRSTARRRRAIRRAPIAAGVKVTCTRYEGVTHAFVSFADALDKGKDGLRQAADALRVAFAR